MSQVYLVTGAARGLGRAFVETYLARDNTTVVATVRDVNASTAKDLQNLPMGKNSKLVVVKINSSSPEDFPAAVKTVEESGISHIDTIIANAGISSDFSLVTKVPIEVFRDHIDTNAYGTLYLIQAFSPLLLKSSNPKFVALGSALGSIGAMDQRAAFPSAAYGPSKAVVHWFSRKLHFENETLTSFSVDPGWVQTDMGYHGARTFGVEKPPTTVEECVSGIVSIIDGATREKHGGHNIVWDGIRMHIIFKNVFPIAHVEW